ncbi:hypothetical protein [Levilactobacillus cerevisiae]|uniref:hypothetical protein n=1 Tax=Levilactobacillus cerevisiae TaxID=1704076 RepID=UPI000F777AD1|nr:hypothetical protein [Levilactobacillus cerevisiae]
MYLKKSSNDDLAQNFFQRDYQDRGMLKWGGFYLSDHTSALAKMHAAEKIEQPLPEQTAADVSERLAAAWQSHRPVHLQLNVMDNNQTLTVIDGVVTGVFDDQIMLQLASGAFRPLQLATIRCVGTAKKAP